MTPAAQYRITLLAVLSAASALPAGGQRAAPLSGDIPVYGQWRWVTRADGLPEDHVRAICICEDEVWIGTTGGLASSNPDGSWSSWGTADGLPHEFITAVEVDPQTQDVWLGTWGGGLIRLSGGQFQTFDQLNSGLAGNLIFDVLLDGSRVWAATHSGLCALNTLNNTWELHFERHADRPEIVITDLCRMNGKLYAAAYCDSIHIYDRERSAWTALPTVPDNDTTWRVDGHGRFLWSCSRAGLLRRQVDSPRNPLAVALPAAGGMAHCLVANEGGAWLGTDSGLLVLENAATNTWVHYARSADENESLVTLMRNGRDLETRSLSSAFPESAVRCLAFKGEQLWLGTDSGVAVGTPDRRWSDLPPVPAAQLRGDDALRLATRSPTAPELNPEVIRIGVLRPGDRTIHVSGSPEAGVPRLGRMDRMAVSLAIELVNARGGYRGRIPYTLAAVSDGAFRGWGWTTPEDDIAAYTALDTVVGVIGYLAPETRMTSAVLLNSEIPFVNFATTPPSTDERSNPWVFRCHGDYLPQYMQLLDYVFEQLALHRVAVLRDRAAPNPAALDWGIEYAHRKGHAVVADVEYLRSGWLAELRSSRPEVILTWSDLATTAAMVRALRAAGVSQPFVGSDGITTDEFCRLAGSDAGTVIALYPPGPGRESPPLQEFVQAYRGRYRRHPTAQSYELFRACNHLLDAIEIAGPDRRAVRRQLALMHYPAKGKHAGTVHLARLLDGKWQPFSPCDTAQHEKRQTPEKR